MSELTVSGVVAPIPFEGQPFHTLGHVEDDWAAIEVWLMSVAANSSNGSQETVNTYRFHIAKLRWYCENEIGLPPSRWTLQEVNAFTEFLKELPAHAICARTGPSDASRPVVRGAPGYTPFRTTPSAGSRADIVRCVHAMFNVLHEAGYIRLNPMQRIKTKKARRIDVKRAVDLDLFALMLRHMEDQPKADVTASRLCMRDRFALVALRELGLRASELVGAAMGDVRRLSDPKSGKTYWVFYVGEANAKGGTARTVPFTHAAMDAFMDYRHAFGLPALPDARDQYPLLLSPRTQAMAIGTREVKSAESRRFFGSWGSLASRKGLYKVVKARLAETAVALRMQDRHDEAAELEKASPHWLRHTFAMSSLLRGRDIRTVAKALGHASVTTTMVYTEQDAMDLIREYEGDGAGAVAQAHGR